MVHRSVNLALETSARQASITLGRGDVVLETTHLSAAARHADALMPAIDNLFKKHHLTPGDLEEIYVSTGPGSFTGLRIGITIAKTLAHATGAAVTAVPTLQVVAQNVPCPGAEAGAEARDGGGSMSEPGLPVDIPPLLAVCLNAKRDQMFTGLFEASAKGWMAVTEPALWSPEELLGHAEGPLALVADLLPPFDWPARVTLLPVELAVPSSAHTWRLGRGLAAAGGRIDPIALIPHYVRLPEAEELWRQRHPNP